MSPFRKSGWGSHFKAPGGGAAGAAYVAAVLADNPVAYYRLGDPGPGAVDQMGGPNGTYTGVTSQAQPSILPHGGGACVRIPSVSGAGVYVPDNPATRIGGAACSFETWYECDATFGSYGSITNGGPAASTVWTFAIKGLPPGTDLYLVGCSQNIGDHVTSTPLAVGTAYHLVYTVLNNGSSTTMTAYVNGVSVFNTTWGAASAANSANGAVLCGSSNGFPANGYFQEFALYNYVLSAAQILAHYNAG